MQFRKNFRPVFLGPSMDNASTFAMATKVGFSLVAVNLITSMFAPTNTGFIDWAISQTTGLRRLN